MRKLAAALMLSVSSICAHAQGTTPGLPLQPLGYCNINTTQLGSAVGLVACTRASFTATATGTSLAVTAVTGTIKIGDNVNGTGVTATPLTTIIAQVSGTPGGAGTYTLNQTSTASAVTLTSGGVPTGANIAFLEPDTAAIRYRDDGAAPTASQGIAIQANGTLLYTGTLSAIQFIAATGSPVLNIAFYRSP